MRRHFAGLPVLGHEHHCPEMTTRSNVGTQPFTLWHPSSGLSHPTHAGIGIWRKEPKINAGPKNG
jgi:hypothetical protein